MTGLDCGRAGPECRQAATTMVAASDGQPSHKKQKMRVSGLTDGGDDDGHARGAEGPH
jgi:hypothetical protein